MRRDLWRRALSSTVIVLCGVAVLVALVPLAFVLFYVVKQGVSALSYAFFTEMPRPVGEVGAAWHGSPGRCRDPARGDFRRADRHHEGPLCRRVLRTRCGRGAFRRRRPGVPSDRYRIFLLQHRGAAVPPVLGAGGRLALGTDDSAIMRTTETAAIGTLPTLREGASRSGHPLPDRFTVCAPPLTNLTGFCLALSRIAGETAPLLFTRSTRFLRPTSAAHLDAAGSLTYAISPYEDLHRHAGPARSFWSRWCSLLAAARCRHARWKLIVALAAPYW